MTDEAAVPPFPRGALTLNIKRYVEQYVSRFDASHNMKHVLRVSSLARHIAAKEYPDHRGIPEGFDLEALDLAA